MLQAATARPAAEFALDALKCLNNGAIVSRAFQACVCEPSFADALSGALAVRRRSCARVAAAIGRVVLRAATVHVRLHCCGCANGATAGDYRAARAARARESRGAAARARVGEGVRGVRTGPAAGSTRTPLLAPPPLRGQVLCECMRPRTPRFPLAPARRETALAVLRALCAIGDVLFNRGAPPRAGAGGPDVELFHECVCVLRSLPRCLSCAQSLSVGGAFANDAAWCLRPQQPQSMTGDVCVCVRRLGVLLLQLVLLPHDLHESIDLKRTAVRGAECCPACPPARPPRLRVRVDG